MSRVYYLEKISFADHCYYIITTTSKIISDNTDKLVTLKMLFILNFKIEVSVIRSSFSNCKGFFWTPLEHNSQNPLSWPKAFCRFFLRLLYFSQFYLKSISWVLFSSNVHIFLLFKKNSVFYTAQKLSLTLRISSVNVTKSTSFLRIWWYLLRNP